LTTRGSFGCAEFGLLVGVEDNPVPLIDTTIAHGEAAVETEFADG
jgi:aspartate racemase